MTPRRFTRLARPLRGRGLRGSGHGVREGSAADSDEHGARAVRTDIPTVDKSTMCAGGLRLDNMPTNLAIVLWTSTVDQPLLSMPAIMQINIAGVILIPTSVTDLTMWPQVVDVQERCLKQTSNRPKNPRARAPHDRLRPRLWQHQSRSPPKSALSCRATAKRHATQMENTP